MVSLYTQTPCYQPAASEPDDPYQLSPSSCLDLTTAVGARAGARSRSPLTLAQLQHHQQRLHAVRRLQELMQQQLLASLQTSSSCPR